MQINMNLNILYKSTALTLTRVTLFFYSFPIIYVQSALLPTADYTIKTKYLKKRITDNIQVGTQNYFSEYDTRTVKYLPDNLNKQLINSRILVKPNQIQVSWYCTKYIFIIFIFCYFKT